MLKSILVDHNPVAYALNKITGRYELLAQSADYVRSLLVGDEDRGTLEKFLFLVGITALTIKTVNAIKKGWQSWSWLPGHFASHKNLSPEALRERYGQCYVCITGFTQGIGYAFAELYAEYGFNLALINRNEENSTRVVSELRKRFPNISIEYAIMDLTETKQIKNLEEQFKKWEHLDIGIVVNNAGTVAGGLYLGIEPGHILGDLVLDLEAVFEINRILVPRMRLREKRSAIFNMSSCTGVYLSPRVGVYSSAKRSLDIYSRILEKENTDKIDVISVRPFGVCTKVMKMKKGPFMITPRECAISSVADCLAGHKITFSGFRHKISSSLMFQHLSEQATYELYEYLWADARAQAEN